MQSNTAERLNAFEKRKKIVRNKKKLTQQTQKKQKHENREKKCAQPNGSVVNGLEIIKLVYFLGMKKQFELI